MTVIKTAGYFFVSTFLVLSSLLKASKSNAQVKNSRFSKVVSFGDSLSDSGNFYALNSKVHVKGNLEGRASNGKVWNERMFPNISKENYAFMSSQTRRGVDTMVVDSKGSPLNVSFGAVGLGYQYELYKYDIRGKDFIGHVSADMEKSATVISGEAFRRKTELNRERNAREQYIRDQDGVRTNYIREIDTTLKAKQVEYQAQANAYVEALKAHPAENTSRLDKITQAELQYTQNKALFEASNNSDPDYRRLKNVFESSKSGLDRIKLALYEDLQKEQAKEFRDERIRLQKTQYEALQAQRDLLVNDPELIEIKEKIEGVGQYEYDEYCKALGEQIEKLGESRAPRKADPNALYTIWAGMNDLRHLETLKARGKDVTEGEALLTAQGAVSNIGNLVANLISDGAKYIVVANLPTIFITSKDKDEGERLVRYFNNQLHQNLVSLASQHKDVNIIPIDIQTLGEELKGDPSKFGLKNAQDPCATGLGSSRKICSNPDDYLFWDDFGHLTNAGYGLLAKYVEEFLRAPYDVAPQVNATEAVAVAATKNVNQRLFSLRGGNHPLGGFASSLVASHFDNTRAPGDSDWATVTMSTDGSGISLPELRKNKFVRRAHSPFHAPQRKSNYVPSLNADVQDGKFGIFVSGDLHLGDQKTTDNTTGYRHHTQTLTWGGDYKFADWFLSGIAMSYINGKTRLKENRGNIDINGYALSLYDSLKWRKFYLDSVFTYGWNQNKIRRNIQYFNRTATGTPLGRHWSFGGLAGYDFSLAGFDFGPNIGLRYGEARINKYKEDNAGAFNLIIGGQKSSSFVSTIGGHIGYKIKTDVVDITPQIRSSYDHEFRDRSRVIVTELASMPGIPFKVPIANNDHNYGRIGGGINLRFKNDLSISFDYETIFARRKARDHFIFGKVRFVF